MTDGTPLLRVRGVSKSFGAVAAVREVSFDLYGGEAHALVGENGAGKSTIVKMLAGVHRPDAGTIELNGVPAELHTPADAKAAGIAVIYQEPTLFPDLTVAENIAMGRQPLGRFKTIDRAAMVRQAAQLFTRLGVSIDPNRPARGLSIADQQLVEIAKALSADARVVVMDEPTAALTGVEVERLFAVARSLRDDGAALMFISHRFEEITALCERVTIMRDGKHVSTELLTDITVDEMVRKMVGRELGALFPKQDPNLKVIVSPTTVGIAAASRCVSASSYKGKVAITGLGLPNQMRQYVKDGTVKKFALWNPADIGYLAAYAGAAMSSGQITGAQGEKFKAGKLGEYTIGADGEIVLGPPTEFTATNIDQFNF